MTDQKKRTDKPVAKILIVDDHPAVREGLGILISRQRDLEVCGEAADVPKALQLVAATNPDAAVIDISLETGNGIDLIKRIKARNAGVRMLVWSMHNENLYAERALRAGAMGYIHKREATSKIVDAIRLVLQDKVYLSESIAARMLRRTVGRVGPAMESTSVESLSDRELEVFQLIGQGLDTHQVAEKMCISTRTVESYRSRIKEKLNLEKGADLFRQAVQWAMENG
jgi:DNA-binding NarL/FixJ family response regulator